MAAQILIVDDMEINLRLLGAIVAKKGYSFEVARSGTEAIQKARKHEPDLILLDIKMPGLNGIETCRILKKDQKLKKIPIVFVSTEVKLKNKGLSAGGVAFLSKPIQMPEILHTLNQYAG